mmetsp:Transcript_4798/g.5595  ORF Transcript_4798/g.5595 Transcript_4798/m.5595 type:complete len:204 (-) Transcript_4798:2569-3180(-)
MNAWVKKNPENQNTVGGPSFNQLEKKCILSNNSLMYGPRGFNDGKLFLSQSAGTWPLPRAVPTFSSSADITTRPLTAFPISTSDFRITDVRPFTRPSSCVSTVFIDSRYVTGYLAMASSRLKSGGRRLRISSEVDAMMSSAETPPAEESRDWVNIREFNKRLVSCISLLMFALSCSPNTSGGAISGRDCTYAMYSLYSHLGGM